jgi:uncharacterized protein with HEPN domain
MPFSPDDLIRHILDEIRFLTSEASALSEDGFMRDKLIHHYFGVDYSLVWNTVQSDIPELEQQLRKLLM